MATSYSLPVIHDIAQQFRFEMPVVTVNLINTLCDAIGSPGITNPVYCKKKPVAVAAATSAAARKPPSLFAAKTGLAADLDQVRLFLNKLTDKTYVTMHENIVNKLDDLSHLSAEDKTQLAALVYELASTNKFYSCVFADLFADLATRYPWIHAFFLQKKTTWVQTLFHTMETVNPEEDYDRFCAMNKLSENRKATTQFYCNLVRNRFLSAADLEPIYSQWMQTVEELMPLEGRRYEVEEWTENISYMAAILRSQDAAIARQARKTTGGSLSNKALFKWMDLAEQYTAVKK